MTRILFWLAIFVLVGWWLRRLAADARAPSHPPPKVPPESPAGPSLSRMEACAHCGVHVVVDEACRDEQGRLYCCAEHLRLGTKATS